MSAAADALVAQIAAQRSRAVPLSDTVSISLSTPSQFTALAIVAALRAGDGDRLVEILGRLATGWKGISQADLLGEGVGSDEPAPFDARLVGLVLGDRPAWTTQLAQEAVALANAAHARAKAIAGN